MKLYAQHGFGDGEKINEGLRHNYIDGAVYSPRDISLDKLQGVLHGFRKEHPRKDFYLDPQMYACFLGGNPEARLGRLLEDYHEYFRCYRRSQLEREPTLREVLRLVLRFQMGLPLTGLIAPNILISRSFDSIEAGIAKDFIRMTGEVFEELEFDCPVYATLAVSRNALTDKQELMDFLSDITVLDQRPAGFYLLVEAGNPDARDEIFYTDIIAGWMMLNHALSLNGFEVINGYSDLLTPFLGAAGGMAGCTGWFSNLRTFSMNRFEPSEGGGRRPNARYLSKALLNRILYYELNQLRGDYPTILNNLPSDTYYDPNEGSQPGNNEEILQSWNALKSLTKDLNGDGMPASPSTLLCCLKAIDEAEKLFDEIQKEGIKLDRKSNSDHLEPLREGIRLFANRAELQLPNE